MICRNHNKTMLTQDNGRSWKIRVRAFNFVSAPYLLYTWRDFHKISVNVRLIEAMWRTHDSSCRLKVKVIMKVQEFETLQSTKCLLPTGFKWLLFKNKRYRWMASCFTFFSTVFLANKQRYGSMDGLVFNVNSIWTQDRPMEGWIWKAIKRSVGPQRIPPGFEPETPW